MQHSKGDLHQPSSRPSAYAATQSFHQRVIPLRRVESRVDHTGALQSLLSRYRDRGNPIPKIVASELREEGSEPVAECTDLFVQMQALPVVLSTGSEVEFSLTEIEQSFHLLEMDAEEGTRLDVSYDLPQGETSGKCAYIARAGVQTWIGGDTFAMLRLRLRVTAGKVRLTRASAYEVRYPFERTAGFACSDPFLNQLWRLCARSLEVLSEDPYVVARTANVSSGLTTALRRSIARG